VAHEAANGTPYGSRKLSGGGTLSVSLLGALAMLLCDNVHGPRDREIVTPPFLPLCRRRLAGLSSVLWSCAVVGVALAGCGLSNGPGSLIVDPGPFKAYHCNDLLARWNVLLNREKDLRNLMSKASEGGGGTVIGTLAYGTDYRAVLTEKKIVQQEAAEKNCELVHTFQSDQTIR